ncbi:MAG: hypothetical protein QOF25_1047 [Mycobacterium sp.]|nr:hypothetical protein [Mycobacterium sp.]
MAGNPPVAVADTHPAGADSYLGAVDTPHPAAPEAAGAADSHPAVPEAVDSHPAAPEAVGAADSHPAAAGNHPVVAGNHPVVAGNRRQEAEVGVVSAGWSRFPFSETH